METFFEIAGASFSGSLFLFSCMFFIAVFTNALREVGNKKEQIKTCFFISFGVFLLQMVAFAVIW